MKRSLIALALAGLLANVAFAQATLTGDDTYEAVHLIPVSGGVEKTSYQPKSLPAQEKVSTDESGIYNFNP